MYNDLVIVIHSSARSAAYIPLSCGPIEFGKEVLQLPTCGSNNQDQGTSESPLRTLEDEEENLDDVTLVETRDAEAEDDKETSWVARDSVETHCAMCVFPSLQIASLTYPM